MAGESETSEAASGLLPSAADTANQMQLYMKYLAGQGMRPNNPNFPAAVNTVARQNAIEPMASLARPPPATRAPAAPTKMMPGFQTNPPINFDESQYAPGGNTSAQPSPPITAENPDVTQQQRRDGGGISISDIVGAILGGGAGIARAFAPSARFMGNRPMPPTGRTMDVPPTAVAGPSTAGALPAPAQGLLAGPRSVDPTMDRAMQRAIGADPDVMGIIRDAARGVPPQAPTMRPPPVMGSNNPTGMSSNVQMRATPGGSVPVNPVNAPPPIFTQSGNRGPVPQMPPLRGAPVRPSAGGELAAIARMFGRR